MDALTAALAQWAEARSFCGVYELMREGRQWFMASAYGAGFGFVILAAAFVERRIRRG